MTMQLVQTLTVGSGGVSSLEFTNIPQTGTDLLLVVSLRGSSGAFQDGYNLNINGLSAANYSWRTLSNGSASAINLTTSEQSSYINAGATTASTFTNTSYYFSSYSSTQPKVWSVENVVMSNSTSAWLRMSGAIYNASISGITSIKFTAFPTFVEHSTISLYTITKGSGGATV